MGKNGMLGLAAQAVTGGVGGIALGFVGAAIAAHAAPEDIWGAFGYAIYGYLVGYALGTVAGVFLTGRWLRRERSIWALLLWCVGGVGLALFITRGPVLETYTLESTLRALAVFIPAVVLTLLSTLFGRLIRWVRR